MDLRIVNTCNSDCVYCLEQSLRKKIKYIPKKDIYNVLDGEDNKDILSFYGGNPLLHPDLLDIIKYAKSIGFKNISLLTNTSGLSKEYLDNLKKVGLNGISFYFHIFDEKLHNIIVQNGISLKELVYNIKNIINSNINFKCIIHVNNQNIFSLYKDVLFLYKNFGINNFEFIKYHLVSRAKSNFSSILSYNKNDEEKNLILLNKVINKLNLNANFVKFNK